jgi:protein-S-isoprenylcysteine O-methyltransferase Ste14
LNLGDILFKARGFTPVPFFLTALIFTDFRQDLAVFGAILIIFGELMRFWGVSYAGGATRTRSVGAPQLVTNGPFAFLRNPLYFGNMFMYMGVSIFSNALLPYLLYATFFFFTFQYYFIIRLEEEKLKELFGEQYLKYMSSVPRMFPRISPYPERSSVRPDIAGALKSERSTFINIVVLILLFFVRWYLV